MDINMAIAHNIRRIREQKKLTLDAAAKVTGVSRSMLIQIEKGDVNPTISVLWKIATGYKTSFTSLVEEQEKNAVVVRASSIQPIVEDKGKYVNFPLFGFDEQRLFETYRIEIEPGGKLEADAHLEGAEEYITLFAGRITITAGEEIFELGDGDSVRFQADRHHSYRNIGRTKALLHMIIYYNN
ncbi:helix-turn-helix domain-containing protein [Dorea sp. D27]|uniref:helix-turn-helix domain-containing protein n=1 Tax=Dorea sp. D27 TaxID=658665 RepID=UPI00067379BD|nr:XRE family transcriptional regulator [Dorea sp. D27]KMZ52752.1 transcriptional regulator, Cro/CI family [Dorea sp. D27]